MGENQDQIAIRNNSYEIVVPEGDNDSLYFWLKNYLEHAVTTAESSRLHKRFPKSSIPIDCRKQRRQ